MSEAENPTKTPEESVSVDGSFQIDQQDDGVYLTVKPAQGDGTPVREPLVMEELKSRDIQDYNFSAIIRIVKESSGTPVKIAEKSAPPAEPEIQVLVDRDRMSASLQIVKPKGSRPLAFDEVLEKIHSAGVVQGIDMEAVKRAYDRPGTPVTAARGDAPVNGTDATISYAYDMNTKGRPVELEDGRVDFKDLNLFTVVAEGDVLAEKLPPTQGTPGVDVLGQPIFPKQGKDIPLPLGKNVYADENKIRAGIAGQLQLQNNKLHVSPVIEIKGDVDLSTGNVEFVGNVVVRGSVQSGFTVKADGNVEIYGSVSGGTVEGNNVVI
ncbi:MAG TPA: FapA family protein, partial [Negativicutes bacterium]|nr:FapA family protein [Negativicutes bacterium]